ncbi:MAG: algC [Ignavibacteria bacterium]|nr:algC [Ignavibacteria bacterium]
MPIIRSISGLRATLGDSITPALISDYTASFSSLLPKGTVVVGNDGRPSGKWIEQIVTATLIACGRHVLKLGVVPTPTVQLFTEKTDAVGGIAITASHNPEQWNGLKFIGESGIFLDEHENAALWQILDNKTFTFESEKFDSGIKEIHDPIQHHIDAILSLPLFANSGMIQKIKAKNINVVVDAVNASGSEAIPRLLESFGCKVIKLYCDGSGIFPHTPEPLPEHLKDLSQAVRINNAGLGIAVDPDADRLVLIDETSNPIGEEMTIVLAIESVFEFSNYFTETKNLCAVVNHSTTMATDYAAKKYGGKVKRSPVGEINVINTMKDSGAIIGGEGSGGVILPACHYGRDSLVGTALILALMAERNSTLSQLKQVYPKFEMRKTKISFDGDFETLLNKVIEKFPGTEIIKEDGIKIIFKDSWLQIRRSNTEPIIRIITESIYPEEISRLNCIVTDLLNSE